MVNIVNSQYVGLWQNRTRHLRFYDGLGFANTDTVLLLPQHG